LVDETDFVLLQINRVSDALSKDDDLAMLNETSILLSFFSSEILKSSKLNLLEGDVDKFINDEETMRIIRLLSKIKAETETGIEYYYKDRGRDERLFYAKELEEQLVKLKRNIRKALGYIVRMNQGVEL
jgi:hypothetical protein